MRSHRVHMSNGGRIADSIFRRDLPGDTGRRGTGKKRPVPVGIVGSAKAIKVVHLLAWRPDAWMPAELSMKPRSARFLRTYADEVRNSAY